MSEEMSNTRWTQVECDRLETYVLQGRSDEEIAEELGRSVAAIRSKKGQLGLKSPTVSHRSIPKSGKSAAPDKRKNGLLIAGIIVAACGLITIVKYFGAGLITLCIGAVLIAVHFIRAKKEMENDE